MQRFVAIGLVGITSVFASGASAQISYRVAAVSGQSAPNTGGAIFGTGFVGPCIDENGRVMFINRLVNGVGDATISNYDCVYSDTGGALHLVARQGNVTPGHADFVFGTNSFTSFGFSANGQAVLHATGYRAAPGAYVDGMWAQGAGGALTYVAMGGDQVPGLPAGVKYQSVPYNYPAMSITGDVPLLATLDHNSGGVTDFNDEVLLVSTGTGPYRIVAREGDNVPSPLGGLISVGPFWGGALHQFESKICVNGGAIAFAGYTSGGGIGTSSLAIFSETHTMAALRVVAGDNQQVPGFPANTTFGSQLGNISLNGDGNVAFNATLTGAGVNAGVDDGTIWVEDGGALHLVARLNDPAPGGGVFYNILYPPQLSGDGWVAFSSWLKVGVGGVTNANDVGIWIGQNQGTQQKIVVEGDPCPGLPAGYVFGGDLALPTINSSHRVAFNGSIRGGAPFTENGGDSIWATDSGGNLVPVVVKGQSFQVAPGDTRTISSCGSVVPGTAAQDGLEYQFNNSNQIAFSLTFSGGSTAVVVANIGGAACVSPNIAVQPLPQSVCLGGSVSLFAGAGGTANLSYQWRRGATDVSNDAHITGATLPTLMINPVGPGDFATDYHCFVSNACGNADTNTAAISQSNSATINGQPQDKTIVENESASFLVVVAGAGTPTYSWRKGGMPLSDGGNLAGTKTAQLIVNPAISTDAGDYDVVITSPCGNLTSDIAKLTVNPGSGPPAGGATPGSGSTPLNPSAGCGAGGAASGTCGAGLMSMMPLVLAGARRKRIAGRRR